MMPGEEVAKARKVLFGVAAAFAAMAIGAGCGREEPLKPGTELPPARVGVVRAEEGEVAQTAEATGTVQAVRVAEIAPKVMARVAAVYVREGQRVRRGQVLVKLDDADLVARLRQAEAAYRQAQERLREAVAARARVKLREADVKNAAAAVAQARAAEQAVAARVMLSYTVIRAPFDGVVSARMVDPGDMASPGVPVVRVEDDSLYRLVCAVPQSQGAGIGLGERVRCVIEALSAAPVDGTASEIVPAADAASRTLTVKVDLPRMAGLKTRLFGRMIFRIGSRRAILLPARAVFEHRGLTAVWAMREGRATLRVVKTGQRVGEKIEIISGVEPGDVVVADGSARLREGQPVEAVGGGAAGGKGGGGAMKPRQGQGQGQAVRELGLAGRLAKQFIDNKLTPIFVIGAVLAGIFATAVLPREEEPQIVVPMIDIFVGLPGATPKEVEERVVKPMEKILWEIKGVEFVYSTSVPGQGLVTVRFYVGQNEEDSLVKVYHRLFSRMHIMPPGATLPLVRMRTIYDVPVLALTLWGEGYDGFELRRIAAQLICDEIKSVREVNEAKIIGGLRRQIWVVLGASKLAGYGVTANQVFRMLQAANQEIEAGSFEQGNREIYVRAGRWLKSKEDVENVVVGVFGGGRFI